MGRHWIAGPLGRYGISRPLSGHRIAWPLTGHGAGEEWLAAGDAAISFDPLAAQGILTAMYSGLLAGQAIGARLRHDGDAIGAYCARLDAIGRAFRQERRRYYQQERRWAGHRYWRRRAGGS